MTAKPKKDPVEQLIDAMNRCAQARGTAQRTGRYSISDRADEAFKRLATKLLREAGR